MNNNALIKCVDELKKETPNISYVLGVLETVIEMSGTVLPVSTTTHVQETTKTEGTIFRTDTGADEDDLGSALSRIGPIATLRS